MKTSLNLNCTPLRVASIKKTTANASKEAREEGTLIHCWRECKLVWPLWKSTWRLLKKLVRPLLGMYLKECKSTYKGDT
jgi:hypothetical protein